MRFRSMQLLAAQLLTIQCSMLVTSICLANQSEAADLRVGAAAVNLAADDSMAIGGNILPVYVKGQEGELRVTAVVIEKPEGNKVALVACDILFVQRDFVDAALTEITKTTGIPESHILVNATHTHHAPSVTNVHGYVRDDIFAKRLQEGIVAAVQQANADLTGGAKFHFHLGEEKTIGQNSRVLLADGKIHWIGPRDDAVKPTGPFDPQLPVLAFRGVNNELRALIYNHSTHTIGTRQRLVRSPGFYGLAAQELEKELGGIVCFLEGASGSTHNRTVPAPVAVTRLKAAIRDAYEKAEPVPVDRVVSIKRRFTFRVRSFDEAIEDKKVVSYCRTRAPSIADSTIDVFRKMRRILKSQQGQQRETWLQVVVIGNVAIVGVPAEYFGSLGIDIKNRSPYKRTYIAELANDWIGYLPDREGHQLGGYQTWMGLHSYAEIGTGERVADQVLEMLQSLRTDRDSR